MSKLKVKIYSEKSSPIIHLPKKEFGDCEYVWVYKEPQLSDSEKLKLILDKMM